MPSRKFFPEYERSVRSFPYQEFSRHFFGSDNSLIVSYRNAHVFFKHRTEMTLRRKTGTVGNVSVTVLIKHFFFGLSEPALYQILLRSNMQAFLKTLERYPVVTLRNEATSEIDIPSLICFSI